MPGKLILVRHGQSVWNVENLFTGWRDVDLSAQGREEAAQAGRELQLEKLEPQIIECRIAVLSEGAHRAAHVVATRAKSDFDGLALERVMESFGIERACSFVQQASHSSTGRASRAMLPETVVAQSLPGYVQAAHGGLDARRVRVERQDQPPGITACRT